jgi:o-succinylbenzoate synthase
MATVKEPMAIPALRTFRYSTALAEPLVLAGRAHTCREGLLVRLESEGKEGWGEVAPLPGFSRETLEDAIQRFENIRRELTGSEQDAFLAIHRPDLAPSIRFGLELAWYNLKAAVRGDTLAGVLGLDVHPVLSINGLLTGDPRQVLREGARMQAEGYRTVKLKVGQRPLQEETDLVHRIRQNLGSDMAIRLDANRAWTFDEAATFVRAVEGCAVEYIEEPLADPSALRRLVESTGLPVALDETLARLSPTELTAHDYAHAVILKPTLIGGIEATLAWMHAAEVSSIKPVLSAAFESSIALSAIAVLAAGTAPPIPAAGLDTYRWLLEDLVEPGLSMSGGVLNIAQLIQTPRTINMGLLRDI